MATNDGTGERISSLFGPIRYMVQACDKFTVSGGRNAGETLNPGLMYRRWFLWLSKRN